MTRGLVGTKMIIRSSPATAKKATRHSQHAEETAKQNKTKTKPTASHSQTAPGPNLVQPKGDQRRRAKAEPPRRSQHPATAKKATGHSRHAEETAKQNKTKAKPTASHSQTAPGPNPVQPKGGQRRRA